MKATKLEIAVMARLLADTTIPLIRRSIDFEEIDVTTREVTGIGFFAELAPSENLKLFADGTSIRWGRVGARLNRPPVDTGYLLYVEDGYLTMVEGYTYGTEWPTEIAEIELHALEE